MSRETCHVIVGLGNPGKKYDKTRHNVGFMALDAVAASEGVNFKSMPKWQAHLVKLPGHNTLLVKPQTFMNLCGLSLHKILSFYQWKAKHVIVIYDDIALPLGTIRFRPKGSSGGHNGIKSIIEHLHTDEFMRLKIGVGNNPQIPLSDFVLGDFLPEETETLKNTLAIAEKAVQCFLNQGFANAANLYNSL